MCYCYATSCMAVLQQSTGNKQLRLWFAQVRQRHNAIISDPSHFLRSPPQIQITFFSSGSPVIVPPSAVTTVDTTVTPSLRH